MVFTWELVRQTGDIIPLLGHMIPIAGYRGEARYASILKYTLSTDDIQSMLRCIVRVDEEREAKNEELIPFHGMCNMLNDKTPG